MESYLAKTILQAITDGDFQKVVGYALVFIVIWLEVRGMKRELKNLNTTVNAAFAKGEQRFDDIEARQAEFDKTLTSLNNFKTQLEQTLVIKQVQGRTDAKTL